MPALDPQTLDAIRSHQDAIIDGWLTNLTEGAQDSRSSMRELTPQVREFWKLLIGAMGTTEVGNLQGREWADTRNFLEDFSRDRVQKGFSSSETANLIFSLKRPLFERVHATYGDAPEQLGRNCSRCRTCSTRWACTRSRPTSRPAKRSSSASRKKCWNSRRRW